jgi:hypothetical protein
MREAQGVDGRQERKRRGHHPSVASDTGQANSHAATHQGTREQGADRSREHRLTRNHAVRESFDHRDAQTGRHYPGDHRNQPSPPL